MDKIMAFGGAIFLAFSFCAATMVPPAAMAYESHRNRHGHVIVLDTIEIVGRVPVEVIDSHEEYDVGDTHIVADGSAIIYASR